MPAQLLLFLKAIGAGPGDLSDLPRAEIVKATWTTSRGIWVLGFSTCRHGGGDTYHLVVDAPGCELDQDALTASEVLELLHANKILNG